MSNRETKRIRSAVMERAQGCCENCAKWIGRDGEDGHLDHFEGRKHSAQSVENCWGICPRCHSAKTLNDPSAVHWLLRFLVHCRRKGLVDQAEKTMEQLEWKQAKATVGHG